MIHGWPDSYRLWDGQAELLGLFYHCARFTLPGFTVGPAQTWSLDELIEHIRYAVCTASPDHPVILLLHDWGCVLGYQFCMRYPHLVSRVIGIDVGDAGSDDHRRVSGWKGQLGTAAYQLWLAAAWWLGGKAGGAMARWMGRVLHVPGTPTRITAQMGYLYFMLWLGRLKPLRPVHLHSPVLFIYGRHKPFCFHSPAWEHSIAASPAGRVVAMETGHWPMVEQPELLATTIHGWLKATYGQISPTK